MHSESAGIPIRTLETFCDAFTWIDPLSDERWQKFIRQNHSVGIFHHPAWLGIISKHSRKEVRALCLLQNNSIVSGIPFLLDGGNAASRQAFSIPCINNGNAILPAEGITETESAFLSALHESNISRCTIRDNVSLPAFPKALQGYIHYLDISGSIEHIYRERITQHCRRSILKSERSELQVDIRTDGEAIQEFHRLHVHTRKRQGLPVIPKSFFLHCHEKLIAPGHGCIIQVSADSRVICSGIFAGFNETYSFKYGASHSDFLPYRPNHAMLWHAIQFAHKQGFKIFDFGRCELNNEGLRRFKLSWGCSEQPLYYTYYPEVISSSVIIQISKFFIQPLIKVGPRSLAQTMGKVAYTLFPMMLS